MTDNNLTMIPTTPNAFGAAIEELKRNFELHLEFKKLDAKLRHAHYLALIEEGFDANQAIAICRGF